MPRTWVERTEAHRIVQYLIHSHQHDNKNCT